MVEKQASNCPVRLQKKNHTKFLTYADLRDAILEVQVKPQNSLHTTEAHLHFRLILSHPFFSGYPKQCPIEHSKVLLLPFSLNCLPKKYNLEVSSSLGSFFLPPCFCQFPIYSASPRENQLIQISKRIQLHHVKELGMVHTKTTPHISCITCPNSVKSTSFNNIINLTTDDFFNQNL